MSIRHPPPTSRLATLVVSIGGVALACAATARGAPAPPAFRQSALDAAGPQAGHIGALWWLFVWVCAIVYVLVLLFLIAPLFRARNRPGAIAGAADVPNVKPAPAGERRMGIVVGACAALTTLLLLGLLVGDMVTGRAIHAMPNSPAAQEPLCIRVTARQWWWEVQYEDWPLEFGERVPSNRVTTANEIHIPVGRPVRIDLQSPDVIHSFWVPNLHGKKDIVPGHGISTWIQADREATFGGQCAEFCGYQHANMRFTVVAESSEKFAAWLEAARRPAAEPAYENLARGRQVFLRNTCVMCHAIAGTEARGRIGPDLTHVASRPYLAAGAIPNAPGHLAGWIVDPQKIKPGTLMPQNPLPPADLRALLEYLTSLK